MLTYNRKLVCNDCGTDTELFQYVQDSPGMLYTLCSSCANVRVETCILEVGSNVDEVDLEDE